MSKTIIDSNSIINSKKDCNKSKIKNRYKKKSMRRTIKVIKLLSFLLLLL